MNHRPRKRFGQNFLTHQAIIARIVDAIRPQCEDNMLEIGPGQGALTMPLLKQVKRLHAIEIDRDLHARLQALPEANARLNLISADALTVDFNAFGAHLRVVGNLPYNISTPLLFHVLESASLIQDMHFMLQKEVVLRLAAAPHSKDFGRLSIMVQYFCEVEHVFDVPPEAFFPQPKVDSAIVRLIPYPQKPWGEVSSASLSSITQAAFAMRRKTIANNLKKYLDKTELEALGIEPTARPEQLTVSDYVKLARHMCSIKGHV